MGSEAQHEWFVTYSIEGPERRYGIINDSGRDVVDFGGLTFDPGGIVRLADAEFIVRACNAHADMLAALRSQLANIERFLATGVPADAQESESIYEQMKAAVAKAEGSEPCE